MSRAGARAPADTGFRVCVRARPALPHEHDAYAERRDAVRVDSSNEITVGGDDSIGPDFARSTTYRFDRVFAPDVGQAAVYEHCARPAVTSLFDGFNSTVMAYGQTGEGKTFTVEGEGHVERAGILPRAARDIFALTSGYNFAPQIRFAVRASYLEIYQEHLTDLLAPADAERPAGGLAIREDRRRGLFVEGLSEWEVRSPMSRHSGAGAPRRRLPAHGGDGGERLVVAIARRLRHRRRAVQRRCGHRRRWRRRGGGGGGGGGGGAASRREAQPRRSRWVGAHRDERAERPAAAGMPQDQRVALGARGARARPSAAQFSRAIFAATLTGIRRRSRARARQRDQRTDARARPRRPHPIPRLEADAAIGGLAGRELQDDPRRVRLGRRRRRLRDDVDAQVCREGGARAQPRASERAESAEELRDATSAGAFCSPLTERATGRTGMEPLHADSIPSLRLLGTSTRCRLCVRGLQQSESRAVDSAPYLELEERRRRAEEGKREALRELDLAAEEVSRVRSGEGAAGRSAAE